MPQVPHLQNAPSNIIDHIELLGLNEKTSTKHSAYNTYAMNMNHYYYGEATKIQPGGKNGNPLQYSRWRDHMDKGAW